MTEHEAQRMGQTARRHNLRGEKAAGAQVQSDFMVKVRASPNAPELREAFCDALFAGGANVHVFA